MPSYQRFLPNDNSTPPLTLDAFYGIFFNNQSQEEKDTRQYLFDHAKIIASEKVLWGVKQALLIYATGTWPTLNAAYTTGRSFIDYDGAIQMGLTNSAGDIQQIGPSQAPLKKILSSAILLVVADMCASIALNPSNDLVTDMQRMWREATHQMVFITIANRTRYSFERTDYSAYKGEVIAFFNTLPPMLQTDEGALVAYGHFASTSGNFSGAASAVTITATSGPHKNGVPFVPFFVVIAGARPITGRNTTEIRVNEGNAKDLADYNDTQGNGQSEFNLPITLAGNATLILTAKVEAKEQCHVVVELTEPQL